MKKLLIVVMLFLAGCGTTIQFSTKTFDDKYALANASLITVNTTTQAALENKAISKEFAQSVHDRSVQAGKLIDEGYKWKGKNLNYAISQLDLANLTLADIQSELRKLGVKI